MLSRFGYSHKTVDFGLIISMDIEYVDILTGENLSSIKVAKKSIV